MGGREAGDGVAKPIDSAVLSPTSRNGNGNGRKRNMRPSCSAFYGTHKFRANCCTGNWFCLWRRPRCIAMAISILQDCQVLPQSCRAALPPPFSFLVSSSSLLQFCLNYFACLFMVESLISALVSLATLRTRRCN